MILTTVSFDRDSLLVDLKNRINVLEAMDTVFSTVKKMQKMAAEQSRAEKTNFNNNKKRRVHPGPSTWARPHDKKMKKRSRKKKKKEKKKGKKRKKKKKKRKKEEEEE